MELDENGVEISPADTVPNPPQDVISVNSSAAERSPGDEAGGDAGVGLAYWSPRVSKTQEECKVVLLVVHQMTTSMTLPRVYLSRFSRETAETPVIIQMTP